MRRFFATLGLVLGLTSQVMAQSWAPILSASRATDWSTAGAGPTVTRTTVCASLSPGATAADINNAIQACPSGQVVSLAAGTYTIGSPGITFAGKSNVTLRGVGANDTFLNFTGSNSCGGSGTIGAICVSSSTAAFLNGSNAQTNTASWTAGYAAGTTVVTLSSKTNMQVGTLMVLGQSWDSAETNNIYVCHGTTCTVSGGNAPWGIGREQAQLVTVTSISGGACPCTIGISPAIRMPNYRSGQSPMAIWGSSLPTSGIGIENLSLNYDGVQVLNGISFYYATNSWVKGVRSVNPGNTGGGAHHIRILSAGNITVRDSYFWGGKDHSQESYGVNPYGASNILVENNIFQYVTSPIVNEGSEGSVFAYNYSIDDFFIDGTWAQASWYTHSQGNSFLLWESNDGFGLDLDNYHGPAFFNTVFRNRAVGKEGITTSQTVPIMMYSYNRYHNLIGNVLGDNAYHTTYQSRAGLDSSASCNFSIYAIGWGGNCGSSGGNPINDSLTNTTLMRWGNYDTVNDASRFVSAEVPSGISPYPNPVPSTQALPATFYLDGKPQFYFLNNVPWPTIGPDVTGGSEPNVGGHNAKIPARRCFENTMGGAFGQRTSARPFNAQSCYGTNATYQAAACNGSSDHLKVQTLVTNAQNTDTILIPAGTCSFGSPVTWLNKALVIRGAGVGSTFINSPSQAAFDINVTTYAGFRLTAMTITSNNNSGGIINIDGNSMAGQISSRFRVDHVTIAATGGTPRHVHVHGPAYGVIDHATIRFTGPGTANGIGVESSMNADTSYGGTVSPGSYACNNFPIDLGGDTAVYVEDTIFDNTLNNNSSGVNDLDYCARMVMRYSSVTGPWHLQTHSTRGLNGNGNRGGIKSEYYNNLFDGNNYTNHPGPAILIAGTGVFFNNRLINQACWWCTNNQVLWLAAQRHPGTSCTLNGAPFGVATGSNPVDMNIESNGWPTLDQPGFVGPMGAQTNVPIYVWNNGSGTGCNTGGTCTGLMNTVFIRCEGEGTAPFRPQDYIKTTAHSNGMKDYCVGTTTMPGSCGTHTNTYTPYIYPHPLTGGGGAAVTTPPVDTTPPATPTGLSVQ